MAGPEAQDAAELWTRCPECAELWQRRKLERRLFVCPRCGYHFRLSAEQRLQMLLDRGSFVEHHAGIGSRDVLDFPDDPPYERRLAETGVKYRPEPPTPIWIRFDRQYASLEPRVRRN